MFRNRTHWSGRRLLRGLVCSCEVKGFSVSPCAASCRRGKLPSRTGSESSTWTMRRCRIRRYCPHLCFTQGLFFIDFYSQITSYTLEATIGKYRFLFKTRINSVGMQSLQLRCRITQLIFLRRVHITVNILTSVASLLIHISNASYGNFVRQM